MLLERYQKVRCRPGRTNRIHSSCFPSEKPSTTPRFKISTAIAIILILGCSRTCLAGSSILKTLSSITYITYMGTKYIM